MLKFKQSLLIIIVSNVLAHASETHENIVLRPTPPPEKISENQQNSNWGAETARKFLQQYNSFNPVVILEDDIEQSQEEANQFFKTIYQIEPKIQNVNFMIMKFNSSGATPILETTQNNKVRFKAILMQAAPEATNYLGQENMKKSAVFFGLLNAAHRLPPFGGIVVFTKREIEDEVLAHHALTEVLKKGIRVFVFWGGEGEERLLKQLSLQTKGGFFANPYKDKSQVYYEQFLANVNKLQSVTTIVSRKNLSGDVTLNFPIDSDVTGIHISITPNITSGILLTPQGSTIDVLTEEVVEYSTGSFLHRDGGIHEIHLNTTTAASQDVGIWRFRVSNARNYYNIRIFAHSKLTANAVITFQNITDTGTTGTRKKIMKLGVTGDISSISNIAFVDRDGHPILDKVKFKLDKDWEKYLTENIDDIETNQKKEIDIDLETLPDEPFYAEVKGKDAKGHDFKRLSYVSGTRNSAFYLPPLTIDVSLGSELITQPYRQPQIHFEVSNNGNSPTFVRFSCRDEKSNLRNMYPLAAWIGPQETTTVRLTLTTRPGVYQDLITFSALASETINKKVIVDVGSTREDTRDPELHYQFTSDCIGVLSCSDGTWTVEVKAKDTDSGLLQVVSRPRGLHFPNGFTTGTTQEVVGYFSESCCRPDLELVALDRQNNRRTRKINAYFANLGPWAIAAIILAIIILIVIIAILVCLCWRKSWWCFKRSKSGSFDITYRGPAGSKRF